MRVYRMVGYVAEGMALFSGALFLLVAFYTTADVIGRRFGTFSGVTDEVSAYVLVTGAMWGLAFALRTGAHVRIDVLLPVLPRPVRQGLDIVATLLMGLFAGILAFYAWRMAMVSWDLKAKALGLLGAPLYIPQWMMAWGLSVLVLEAVLLVAVKLVSVLFLGGQEVAGSPPQEEG
ncbi:MAG: TRAP transporter small permease [Chloroflexota bacterium]|nr:TRAP transporter small permease [Chloroflexota bacterium]